MTPNARFSWFFVSLASARRARALWGSVFTISLLAGCDPTDEGDELEPMATGGDVAEDGDGGGRPAGDGNAPGGDGAEGGNADGADGDTGDDALGGDGTSCGELLQCYGGCSDGACMTACYEAASPQAQAQDDALYACEVEHGCADIECIQAQCAAELEACLGGASGGDQPPAEPPAGSWLCYAQGVYEVCTDGWCQNYTAQGAGIGPSEAEAGSAATINCDLHMTNMVIINNINGSASVVSGCAVTSCSSE